MDITLQSSVIFAVIIGLWLVFVAPQVLRLRKSTGLPEADTAVEAPPPSTSQGQTAQRTTMNPTAGTSVPAARPAASAEPVRRSGEFRIRYGRTALALAGVLALVTAVVGGVLALFGLISAAVPAWALLAAVAVVASLRALAVRDRRLRAEARIEEAFREAMNPLPVSAEAPARRSNAPVFNVQEPAPEAGEEEGPDAAEPALTAEQLRAAARAVAAASVQPSTWEPVDVPKPTYVVAAKANRQAPEPLVVPADKKPLEKTSFKQAAAAPAGDPPAEAKPASAVPAEAEPGTAGRINLDDVLQRRRA